jgi:hypothetical protein
VLLQHPDDLIFREPCSLHLSVLQEGRTLNPRGGKSQWQVNLYKFLRLTLASFGLNDHDDVRHIPVARAVATSSAKLGGSAGLFGDPKRKVGNPRDQK